MLVELYLPTAQAAMNTLTSCTIGVLRYAQAVETEFEEHQIQTLARRTREAATALQEKVARETNRILTIAQE